MVYLKRNWDGKIQNISVLVAIGVSQNSYWKTLSAAEGMNEDCESWCFFFVCMNQRKLTGIRLIMQDKNLGILGIIPNSFPDARYQCYMIFLKKFFYVTPLNKMKIVPLCSRRSMKKQSRWLRSSGT